jgi:hypothetical protein
MIGGIVGVCAFCGCTDTTPCTDQAGQPCSWVTPALCSVCATRPTDPGSELPASASVFGYRPAADHIPPGVLLDFEAAHPGISAGKAEAVRRTFGIGFARWTQLIHAVIRSRAALEHDPVLTHQLQDRIHRATTARAALLKRSTT